MTTKYVTVDPPAFRWPINENCKFQNLSDCWSIVPDNVNNNINKIGLDTNKKGWPCWIVFLILPIYSHRLRVYNRTVWVCWSPRGRPPALPPGTPGSATLSLNRVVFFQGWFKFREQTNRWTVAPFLIFEFSLRQHRGRKYARIKTNLLNL